MPQALYNISPQEFYVVERKEYGDNVQYTLEAVNKPAACPLCKSVNIIGKGVNERSARDLSEFGKLVGLQIRVHRYKCKDCLHTWSDEFKSVPPKAKITKRMREYICKRSLNQPFSVISKELDVSVPTIKEIFHEHVSFLDKERDIEAPYVLGIDENMLLGKYRAIYTDIENGRIIDLQPNRDKDNVIKWLRALPGKERIRCITIDMWGSYKDAVQGVLPNIPIVIDKFHVIKQVNTALDSIRVELSKDVPKSQRIHLKNSRWLMLTNADEMDESPQLFLHDLLETFPELRNPHKLKEDFRQIYRASSRQEAEELFTDWVNEAQEYDAYKPVINTVNNWHTEIFNYFDYKYTNATTESLNRLVSEINQRGRGYSFDVLRMKAIYGTNAAKGRKYRYYKDYVIDYDESDTSSTRIMEPPKLKKKTVKKAALVAVPGVDIDILCDEVQQWENMRGRI